MSLNMLDKSLDDPKRPLFTHKVWPWFLVVPFYLLNYWWLSGIIGLIQERIDYGTAETGWWGIAAAVTLLPMSVLLAIPLLIALIKTPSWPLRILIGLGFIVFAALMVAFFGSDTIAIALRADPAGGPTHGYSEVR